MARRLLDWAEVRLDELGATRIDAMVRDDNLLAHPAWAAAGYGPQTEWSRRVKPSG